MAVNPGAIAGIGAAAGVTTPAIKPQAAAGAGFGDMLGQLIDSVETTTGQANTVVTAMMNKTADVHDAMIALHQAETTLQLKVQIRNKLVNAYQDIMRMPI